MLFNQIKAFLSGSSHFAVYIDLLQNDLSMLECDGIIIDDKKGGYDIG